MYQENKNMSSTLFLAVTLLLLSRACCKELPSFVKPCVRNGQDLNACTKRVMYEIKDELAKGIPSMGVPPIEPITIPRMELNTGNGTNFAYEVNFTNIVFAGAKDFEINDTKIDLDAIEYTMIMYIPKFVATANYKNHGKILLLEFDSDGVMRANFTGILIDGVWKGTPFMKNGNRHFKFVQSKVDVQIDEIGAIFDDVFKGNPELTDNFNRVVDENSEYLYDEIKPVIGQSISRLITTVINRVYNNFSVDQLYPPEK